MLDFKRIQIIFLITFVIIDIFLFSLFHRNQSIQNDNPSNNNSTSIVAEMHDDQISFRNFPSDKSRTGYYIAAKKTNGLRNRIQTLNDQNVHYDDYHLDSTFKRPITLSSSSPHVTINHLLRDPSMIAYGRHYHYCPELSNANDLVYIQKARNDGIRNDILSSTSEIKFHVVDHMLNGYSQSYVSGIRNLREKSATISAERALTLLYQYNNIPNNTKIEWCHFAYTRLLSVKGNDVYIPTWIVAMKVNSSSELQYRDVNAFSGSIISTNDQN